jgi:hypothetical protein
MLISICFLKVGLVYSIVGAGAGAGIGAAGAHQNFCPELEPHQYDAALQH